MSFDQLRSKVVILQQVFSLKRSKDVGSIVSSSMVLNFDFKVSHFRMRGDTARPYPILHSAEKPLLCTASAVKAYMSKTEKLVKDTEFLILSHTGTLKQKATALSPERIGKICLGVMKAAKISDSFKSHSLRLAGTTHMLELGIPIDDVMKIGGWTSRAVFDKFYNRKRINPDIGNVVIGSASKELVQVKQLDESVDKVEVVKAHPKKRVSRLEARGSAMLKKVVVAKKPVVPRKRRRDILTDEEEEAWG